MPENTEEQELKNRTEQVNARKESGETVILDGNGQRDDEEALSENVFKIEDLLIKESNNPVVRRLNRLKDYGLTDEMILNAYSELAGNVTKDTDAIAVLKVIFDRYVEYISSLPNGIVINPLTGREDEQASYEQKLEVGIITDPFKTIDMDVKITLDDVLNIDREALESGFLTSIHEYKCIMSSLENLNLSLGNSILNYPPELIVFPEEIKDTYSKKQDDVKNSIYSQDSNLLEITKLEIAKEDFKGTDAYTIYQRKVEDFYKEHPEYVGQVPVRDENGNLDGKQFGKDCEFLSIVSLINNFKMMTEDEKANITPNDRKVLFLSVLSALQYNRKRDPGHKLLVAEAQNIIKEHYPDFDMSKSDSMEQKKLYLEILQKELGVGQILDSVNITNLYSTASEKMKWLLEDKQASIERFDEIDSSMLDSAIKDNALGNYFIGSKIEFGRDKIEAYGTIYNYLTVDSWFDDKQSVLEMRYATLKLMKEDYEKKSDKPYIAEKIESLNAQLQEFEEKYGNLGLDNSVKDKEKVETYKDNVANAHIMKYYTMDAIEASKGKNYDMLDDEHKKAYLRNTLLGLDYINNSNTDFCFTKVVMRRLELMNTEDKKFITLDKDGNFTINKDLLVKEYSEMSQYDFNSFEELLEYAHFKKDEYVLDKLERYSGLDEKKFVKLKDRTDLEKSVGQIEMARAIANAKEKLEKLEKEGVKIGRAPKGYGIKETVKFRPNKINGDPIQDKEFINLFKEKSVYLDSTAVDELRRKAAEKKSRREENSQEENKRENKKTPTLEENGQGVDDSNNGSESTANGENTGITIEESNTTMALMPKKQNNIINIFKKAVVDAFNRLKETILSKKKDEEKKDATIENVDKNAVKGNDPETKDWLKRVVSSETQQKFAREAQQSHDSRKTNATPVPEIGDEEQGR